MKRKLFSMVKKIAVLSMAAILLIGCTGCGSKKSHVRTITNVSYDPTREFYEAYNPLFEKYYKEKTGKEVKMIREDKMRRKLIRLLKLIVRMFI